MFDQVEAFYRPESVPEALRLLARNKDEMAIVAGGTDLIVEGGRTVRFLLDLTRAGLSYIRRRESVYAIGATTTLTELEESTAMHALARGLLSRSAGTCGSVQIRNRATVGGNLAHGSAAADMTTPLLVLDAAVVIANGRGRRKLPLAEYLKAAGGEDFAASLLIEVIIPEPPRGAHYGWSFQKFGRTEMDISLVNVAAGVQLDGRRRVKEARLALGAVAEFPFRACAVEKLMEGRELDQVLLAEVGEEVVREIEPVSDVRASAKFRRELSRVLVGRALEDCAAQAGCSL